MQQYVATRESEREKFIATQGQTTAEERQRLQAFQTQIATERAQQADLFNATILQLVPELQKFNGIDWNKLSVEKPAEWAQQFQAFNDLNARLNSAQSHLANLRAQQAAEGQQHHQNYLNEQKQLLIQKIPEFADPVKGVALREDMTKHLTEFTKEELHSIADHRYLMVARDALLWRKAEAARKAAQTKRVIPAASNVRPLRPAGRQDVSAGDAAQGKQLEALHGKLAKTGSYRDAADILTASGIFGK